MRTGFGCKATAEECPRIPEAFLAEEKRRKSEGMFRQEYLCEFVSVNGALFDEDAVRRLVTDDVRPLVHR